jgi:uncharacterized protein (TIGR03066 family)
MEMKRVLATVAIAIVFVAGASADDKKIDAAKLVGKWEVTKSESSPDLKGALIEFSKDNKVTVNVEIDGKKRVVTGTYKVDGDKLTVTFKEAGKETSDTDMIKSVTDDKIVLVDTDKKETELGKKK